MMQSQKIDFTPFQQALTSLKDSLQTKPQSLLERDGVIQRFEYTFELAWKFIRRVLISMGRNEVSSSPKPLLRDAFEEGWIEDLPKWFAFLEARNLTVHIYNPQTAEKTYEVAVQFAPYADALLKKLQTQCK